MRRALLIVVPMCWLACKAGTTGAVPGSIRDGGPDLRRDAGTDGGDDGGPEAFSCSVAAQDCDAGVSCLSVDGGPGTACLEGACDLVKQDCDAGSQCTYRTDDAGVTARACLPEGSADEGQPCPTEADPYGCKKGLLCIDSGDDAGTGVCARLCDADTDCTAPATCDEVLTLAGTVETPTLCIALPSCDLFAQDCSGSGSACYIGRSHPRCHPAGMVPVDGACEISSDCVKGAACAHDGTGHLRCRPMCGTSGSPVCISGTCTPAQSPAPAGVGICL